MILLPGHHSRRRERQGTEDMDRVTIAGLPGQGVGLGDGMTPTTPANEKTVDPASVAAGPSEFDEYGAELGPEARVWKTYVREADKFDMELVEEWNKSLDVILIFAALFSAISSTFVMDSTRKLQQDPSDTSAQTLTIISQTLMAMANNNTPPSGLASPPSDDNFSPRRAIVMVNILWFLSLSLSVAVSLIAMLAKEWCHAFMAGRTGHPCAQARRRQRRWNGLTQWRMPEVLVILPSLTHLALLLFAVGLCIYLWDIHSGVAVPVIVVTVCASGIYMASTILPLVYEHCPYSTTISRLAQQFYDIVFPKKGSEEDDYIKQDRTTSEALGWLIESCEDPRSVDIALQAIAGADKELPLDALRHCNASVAVSRRLTAGSAYPKNYATVFSLYARALAVLQPSTGRGGDGEQYDHVNELKRKIRVLQTATERDVAHLLSTEPFFPKQVNLWALRIGSTAPSLCLRSLNYVEQEIMFEALKAGIDLLEKVDGAHRSRQKKMSMILPGTFKAMRTHRIHPASLQSLVKGLTTLLSCSLIHSDISTVAPHVVRLLHIEEHREHCRIFLAVLAISRNDYPGWTHPAPLDAAARAERAIELLAHYELTPDPIPARTLMVLGLFELLLCSRDYGLVDRDFTRIYELLRAERWADGTQVSYNDQFIHALPPVTRNNPQTIHTFPASFDLDQYHLNALTEKLSNTEQRSSILSSVASTEAHLGALCFICNQSLGTFPPQIYVFILEAVCLASSDLAQSMAMDLMIRFPPPELTEDLAQILVNRNTFEMLARGLDSGNPSVEAFATTQIRMLMQLVLQSSQKLSDGAILVLSKLCQRDDLCHPLQRLEMIKQGLRGQFTLVDRAVRRPDILPPWIELYLRRRGAEHS